MKKFESSYLTLTDMESLELIFRLQKLGAEISDTIIKTALVSGDEDYGFSKEEMQEVYRFLQHLETEQ